MHCSWNETGFKAVETAKSAGRVRWLFSGGPIMNPSCHQKPAPHRRIAAPFAAWLSLAALLTPTLSPAREEQVGFAELAEQHPIGFADLVEHQMNTVVNIATLQKVPAAEASPDA